MAKNGKLSHTLLRKDFSYPTSVEGKSMFQYKKSNFKRQMQTKLIMLDIERSEFEVFACSVYLSLLESSGE